MKVNTEGDFWPKVEKSSIPDACWLWLGCFNGEGYGAFKIRNKQWKTHRLAFLLYYGYLPKVVRHTCHNIKCVNPHHLLAGSPKENNLDKLKDGTWGWKLTKKDILKIIQLYKSGLTHKEIAKLFNVGHTIIGDILSGARWAIVTKVDLSNKLSRSHKEAYRSNGSTKLLISEVKEILGLKDKIKASKLAQQFNVSISSIWNIWNGITWKHIQELNNA
jgi:transposase